MIVGDRDGVLACFDETASVVFATLGHLTAGDVDLALDLTVETYAYLARMAAATSAGVDADRRWMIAAAHSVYAAGQHPTGAIEPIAALAPLERVALSLETLEHWEVDDIAALVDVDADAVRSASAAAMRLLGTVSAEEALRACEVWFDDQMRTDVRAAIANGTTRTSRPTATPPALPGSAPVHNAGPMDTATEGPSPARRQVSSRRITVAALVASAAAIGALALWVRPSDTGREAETLPTDVSADTSAASTDNTDGTSARPPETTTPFTVDTSPPITSPATSPPTTAPPLTGFVSAGLPAGFQAGGGYADGRDSVSRRNWFELWSTDDATRTSGRWFGLVVVDDSIALSGPEPATNAVRVEVGGQPALARSSSDGVTSLVVRLPGREYVELRSFGYATDELTTLLGALDVGIDNRPHFGPSAAPLLDGLELRTSEATNQATPSLQAFSRLESSAFYLSADGVRTITINAGPQSPNDLLASRLLSPPPAGPAGAYAPDGHLVLDGIPRVAGTLTEADMNPTIDPYSFVQWHRDGLTITVLGDVPAEQLFEVARQVRPATPDEWVSQSRAVPVITSTQVSNPPAAGTPTIEISSSRTNAGPTWTVSIDRTVNPGAGGLSLVLAERRSPDPASTGSADFDESQSWFALQPDPAHPVREYNAIDATIVVVVLTAPPEGAKVRLTLGTSGSGDGTILPLVPVGDDVWVAAYAFSEQSAYTVELMEIDGSTVISALSQ